MDASNGWSVQLGYVLDPETAPTWPDMSRIHSDHRRIVQWYNKDTAMTCLGLYWNFLNKNRVYKYSLKYFGIQILDKEDITALFLKNILKERITHLMMLLYRYEWIVYVVEKRIRHENKQEVA